MIYKDITPAIFIKRINRFIAHATIEGKEYSIHVKNTGRCQEILIPGTKIFVQRSHNPARKTPYSLISAYKGEKLINIDSTVPNDLIFQALKEKQLSLLTSMTHIKREVTYGNSRFDLYCENANEKAFIEVKGVTLEHNDLAMFPDAPTIRGTKHVLEMIKAVEEGYKGFIVLVVQMKGIKKFKPNEKTDPVFCRSLRSAAKNNVNILCFDCCVTPTQITLNQPVPVLL